MLDAKRTKLMEDSLISSTVHRVTSVHAERMARVETEYLLFQRNRRRQ
jgi:hypothetical protein